MREKCSNCGNTYKNIHSHQKKCKFPKKPGKYVAGQEGSGSASDVNDMLDFAVVRRPRSSRNSHDAMTGMDDEEAIVLLQELRGKDKSSEDDLGRMSSLKKPAKNVAGQEEVSGSASDGNDMLDFAVVRRPRSSRNSRDEMNDMDAADSLVLLQELRGKDKSSDDESGVEHSGVESAADNPDVRAEFDAAIAVIDLLSLKPKRNSASADLNGGTEKCANLALSVEEVEETELTRNDDGQRLVDCPESSAVMELKQPKPDLKVSGNSENPASDDGQGGINDASGLGMPKGKQTSLTEPMAREVDQEPKQKLDSLLPPKEQAAMVTTSVDEPGEESGADNSDEVLTSCSEKSTCSVEYYGGGENTSDSKEAASAPLKLKRYISEKSGNEAPVVEEEDLSCGHSHQALADCPENSAGTELKKPKLDHKALDKSVLMQEEKHKIDLTAPAPSDSSEEERSDIIDGQANQTP